MEDFVLADGPCCAIGDPRAEIRLRVTLSEAVEVEGGSGTASLAFAYRAVEPNESTRGIAAPADTLEADGETIRSAATSADAHLSHTGLGHDSDHKVDWRLRPAPSGTVSATGVATVSDTGEDDGHAGTGRSEAEAVRVRGGAPMSKTGDRDRKIEALRERISTLAAAILRISASLDLDTVLREIAAAARALTGARYAVITTVDATGQLDDAVTAVCPGKASKPSGRRSPTSRPSW